MAKAKWTIAIDGPAGAGKSTVAKLVAKRLKIKYIDSGAVYRAITWKAIEEKIDLNDKLAIIELTKGIKIELRSKKRVFVADREVTKEIRKPIIDQNISLVAKNECVREQVVKLLQELSTSGGVIMEGRDITTVVLPQADIKFYLDADVTTRADRRYKELLAKGEKDINLTQIQQEIEYRDTQDKTRTTGPLVRTKDAIYFDTSNLTIKQVVSAIIAKVKYFHRLNWDNKFYSILYFIAVFLFKILYNLKVTGQENIPLAGGVLIAANHVSYADPPVMAVALPRQTYYVAKEQLFEHPFLRWLFRNINVFSIKQSGASPQTFKKILNLLEQGRAVVIFPEGQRSLDGKLQAAKPGIGMMISKAMEKCPQSKIIPAKILGTDKILPRGAKWLRSGNLEVRFGKPIDVHQLADYSSKEKYQAIADAVMERISKL
ncbi:MAG: (d)CMP kinase [bacterium]|nr:(d)CMP kinase [bacterium]